jgi:preprotein translocase subunit SecA
MMHSISQDFVRYVMHAQVTVAQQPAGEQAVSNMRYSAPDEQSAGSANMAAAARAEAAANPDIETGVAAPVQPDEPAANVPVVKTEWDKTPRNAPCPCGSGKKFKMCHGR